MILNVDRLDDDAQTIAADDTFSFADAFGNPTRLLCHTRLHVRRVGETYYIKGHITGVFSTACHKCLADTNHEVQSSIALVVQRGGSTGGQNAGVGDDDLVLMPRGQRELELDQQIYESIMVNIPMQIACSEGCKGLCTDCGANLNTDKCTCNAVNDSRWEELRQLRNSVSE